VQQGDGETEKIRLGNDAHKLSVLVEHGKAAVLVAVQGFRRLAPPRGRGASLVEEGGFRPPSGKPPFGEASASSL